MLQIHCHYYGGLCAVDSDLGWAWGAIRKTFPADSTFKQRPEDEQEADGQILGQGKQKNNV